MGCAHSQTPLLRQATAPRLRFLGPRERLDAVSLGAAARTFYEWALTRLPDFT